MGGCLPIPFKVDAWMAASPYYLLIERCPPILNKIDWGMLTDSFQSWWANNHLSIILMEGCLQVRGKDWWFDAHLFSIVWRTGVYQVLWELMHGWMLADSWMRISSRWIDGGILANAFSNSWMDAYIFSIMLTHWCPLVLNKMMEGWSLHPCYWE